MAGERHLNDELWAELSRSPASEGAKAMAAHLASSCDDCERYLAERFDPAMDGAVDRVLLGLAPRPEAPLDEVGWARLRRRLEAQPPRQARWPSLLGMAAGLLLVVGLARLPLSPEPWTLKGTRRITVELFAAQRAADGTVSRVEPGQRVAARGALLLRYHATESGRAVLFVQRGSASPEPLGSFALTAGTEDLRTGTSHAALSLEGETGPLTLWLVAAPEGRPLTPAGAASALHSGTPEGGLAVARLEIVVR